MQTPKPPKKGPPWYKKDLKERDNFAVTTRPLKSESISLREMPGQGTIHEAKSRSRADVSLSFFQLVATNETPSQPKLRIVASTLAGELPTGFSPGDDPTYLLTPNSGANDVWGIVSYEVDEDGAVTIISRTFDQGADGSMPAEVKGTIDVDGIFYVLVGSYIFNGSTFTAVANYRYGPIDVNICRDWFSSTGTYSATAVAA